MEVPLRAASGGMGMCFNFDKEHRGSPTAKSNFDVLTPKTVVDEVGKNFDTMMAPYESMYMMLGLDLFEGSPVDAAAVLAMPLFLLKDAVSSMKEVKKVGQEERDRRAKELIFKIPEGIIFLIPFVGAVNLELAPVAILAMVLGGLGAGSTRGALRHRELVIAKGKISSEQKNNIGASFRLHNHKVETLMRMICLDAKGGWPGWETSH
ncbi:hypothetical protein N657DRAFT_692330 [Parathielavia appendiculata]|uniref:Uncharacterized protein n=1 Tax=Parathielavia appendiculata TaxID=2587402 RepID=A0AAN6TV03_9PEZI|nr:hypothetical protein N657DRAFT_692330 [Parathielavia appendiculata]